MKWFFGEAERLKKVSNEQLLNITLFDGDAFFGRLLCLSKGQVVPVHKHGHKDECFDVLQGSGTLLVDGREFPAGPGAILFVPAGFEHGLRADGTVHWIVRETVSERIYAARAARMVIRAALQRLRSIGKR